MIPLESLQFVSSNIEVKYVLDDGESDRFILNLNNVIIINSTLCALVFNEIGKRLYSESLARELVATNHPHGHLMFGEGYIRWSMANFGIHRVSVKGGIFSLTFEVDERGNMSQTQYVDE